MHMDHNEHPQTTSLVCHIFESLHDMLAIVCASIFNSKISLLIADGEMETHNLLHGKEVSGFQ